MVRPKAIDPTRQQAGRPSKAFVRPSDRWSPPIPSKVMREEAFFAEA